MTQRIVLVNLGTPDEPTETAIRRYLKEFLSDPRVVALPRIVWLPILYLFILPFRPTRLAFRYAEIWDDDSPIRTITKRQAEKLQARDKSNSVEYAMTYGKPCIDDLAQDASRETLVIPLFPQYTSATTEAVCDRFPKTDNIRFVRGYHDHPLYIDALASSVTEFWSSTGQTDKLLMSFHGLPKAQDADRVYSGQCEETAALLARRLNLAEGCWQTSYQSRMGPAPWLQPYTDQTLRKWANQGVSSVAIVSPGFAADCLETLEEIDIQCRQIFLNNGGQHFHYIPALNDRKASIDLLEALVKENL